MMMESASVKLRTKVSVATATIKIRVPDTVIVCLTERASARTVGFLEDATCVPRVVLETIV